MPRPPNEAPLPPWRVERVDLEDGTISYEIWAASDYGWILTIRERDHSNAKELADLIVQRTKP